MTLKRIKGRFYAGNREFATLKEALDYIWERR